MKLFIAKCVMIYIKYNIICNSSPQRRKERKGTVFLKVDAEIP